MNSIRSMEEARRFFESEFTLSRERMSKADDIARIRASAGTEALEQLMSGTGTVSPLARRIADAEEEIQLYDAAIGAARRKRAEFVEKSYKAVAADLRSQAAKKRAAADRHQVKTDRLLAELKEHEGVDYDYVRPSRPTPAMVEGRITGLGADVVVRKVSQTEWLRLEAQDLEMSARSREAQRVRNGGTVQGDSIEALINAIEDLGVEILGPPIVNVAEWIGSGVAQDAERRRAHYRTTGAAGAEGVIVFEVQFRNGEIDRANSSARLVVQEAVSA